MKVPADEDDPKIEEPDRGEEELTASSCVTEAPLRVSGDGTFAGFIDELWEEMYCASDGLDKKGKSLVFGETGTESPVRDCGDGWLPERRLVT